MSRTRAAGETPAHPGERPPVDGGSGGRFRIGGCEISTTRQSNLDPLPTSLVNGGGDAVQRTSKGGLGTRPYDGIAFRRKTAGSACAGKEKGQATACPYGFLEVPRRGVKR